MWDEYPDVGPPYNEIIDPSEIYPGPGGTSTDDYDFFSCVMKCGRVTFDSLSFNQCINECQWDAPNPFDDIECEPRCHIEPDNDSIQWGVVGWGAFDMGLGALDFGLGLVYSIGSEGIGAALGGTVLIITGSATFSSGLAGVVSGFSGENPDIPSTYTGYIVYCCTGGSTEFANYAGILESILKCNVPAAMGVEKCSPYIIHSLETKETALKVLCGHLDDKNEIY